MASSLEIYDQIFFRGLRWKKIGCATKTDSGVPGSVADGSTWQPAESLWIEDREILDILESIWKAGYRLCG